MRSSESRNPLSTVIFAVALAFGVSAGFVSTTALAVGELSMPSWGDLFNPNGTFKDEFDELGAPRAGGNGVPDYIDLYNGIEAEFVQDNISNGIAIDMSAFLEEEALSDSILFNGTVDGAHDLGNTYFLATSNEQGHPQFYLGVERLYISADSFIEFEFNQDQLRLSAGAPWFIEGGRTDGDLLVRMTFTAGSLTSVDLERWEQGAFQVLEFANTSPGDGCTDRGTFVFCVGPTPLEHPAEGFEVWNAAYQIVPATAPDDFVEIGVDIAALVGAGVNYTGFLIRTAEDVAMNRFRVLGRPGQGSAP